MENNIASLGTNTALAPQRSNGTVASAQPNGAAGELLAPTAQSGVSNNVDIPSTSRIPEVDNQTENRTNRVSQAEVPADPAVQQRQIESFLAQQTGEDAENFEGIDIETALELQESFRDRPAQNDQAAAQTPSQASPQASSQNSEQPVDTNDQQNQELIQRLQTRLADQIPNDPGTEFPQLIETIA